MKCPVMSQPFESGAFQSKWHSIDCLKEECEWWDGDVEGCEIKSIRLALCSAIRELDAIAKELTLVRGR